jgi:hypothetical protein
MKKISLLILILGLAYGLKAQAVQVVRGTVSDKDTKEPLIGASVVIKGSSLGVATDQDGNFKITGVPLGRQTIVCSYIGYATFEANNIIINSAKEAVFAIEMIEDIAMMQEVVVSGRPKGNAPVNEMSLVSTRSFSVEETQRFAAAANDPGRMATSFPGVQPSRDNRSDIIVRGNSGIGLGWRLEGIDIPNPNHFARIGSSGGGITIFSASMLANSDFSTGAFAAEYGNAISGVFDMKFRKGNTEKREYTFRAGMLGLDLATEGPFKKGGRASYLINYRYSTLGILNQLGLHLVGPRVDNTFQDLSLNLNFPSKNGKSIFNIWSIGGLSREFEDVTKGVENWKSFDDYKSYHFNTNMGAAGLAHTYILANDAYIKTSLAIMGQQIRQNDDTLTRTAIATRINDENYLEGRYALSSFINKKFSPRITLKTGFALNQMFFDLNQKSINPDGIGYFYQLSTSGQQSTWSLQPYAQLRLRPNEKWTLNIGLHSMLFGLNSHSKTIEPRLAIRYQLTENQHLSLALGRHSRILPLGTYYYQQSNGALPNIDLPLLKSHQIVLAHEINLAQSLKIHTELYYQHHFDVPVNGTWSILNTIVGFVNRDLVAKGTGTNYGLDISLEKTFEQGCFYLVSASLFSATYKDEYQKTHSTTFNSHFAANATIGKEWTLKRGAVLQVGGRLIYNGGQRLTPLQQGVVLNRYALNPPLDESRPFSEKVGAYFRPDARIALRKDKKKVAYTLALDIQNVMNRNNIDAIRREFDPDQNAWIYRQQSGLTPLASFQLDF